MNLFRFSIVLLLLFFAARVIWGLLPRRQIQPYSHATGYDAIQDRTYCAACRNMGESKLGAPRCDEELRHSHRPARDGWTNGKCMGWREA